MLLSAATQSNLKLQAQEASVYTDDEFTVTLSHTAMTISSFAGNLFFDSAVLSCTDIAVESGFSPTLWIGAASSNSIYSFDIGVFSTGKLILQ